MRKAGGLIALDAGVLAALLAVSTILIGDTVRVLNSAEVEIESDPIFVPKPKVHSGFKIEDWAS